MSAMSNFPIKPRKKLTVADIFDFPPNTQKIILSLLNLEKATVKKLQEETKFYSSDILTICRKLVRLGYIGEDRSNGDIIFFCNI